MFGKVDQRVVRLAISGFATGQVERERASEGIGQAVKLTGEPAPRAAKTPSMNPPSARCRNMRANRGAIDAVVAAVRHDFGERVLPNEQRPVSLTISGPAELLVRSDRRPWHRRGALRRDENVR